MIFKLTASTVFPEGTTVYAYHRDAAISGTYPIGDAVSSGVMSATSVLFGDLDASTAYTAYALVNGAHRYVRFRTDPEAIPDAAALGAVNVTAAKYGVLPGFPGQVAGVLNAKTDADALGVPVYFPGGKHNYLLENTTPIQWTGGSYPIGDGSSNSIIQFTAGGGFAFGDPAADGFGNGGKGYRGMQVGGFGLWGGPDYAGRQATNPLLGIYQAVQSTFKSIEVKYGAADGIRVEQAQNCQFTQVNAEANGLAGIVLDRGTGGHNFTKCEFTNNGRFNLVSTETAHRTSGYQRPSDNHFDACIIERLTNMDSSHQASLYLEAGENITFHACNIVGTSSAFNTSAIVWLNRGAAGLSNTLSSIRFTDCWFYGSNTASDTTHRRVDVFRVTGGGSVTVMGGTMQNPGDGDGSGGAGTGGAVWAWDNMVGFNAYTFGRINRAGYTTYERLDNGSGSADTVVRHQILDPVQVIRDTTSQQGYMLSMSGENGSRVLIKGSGLYLGDGSSSNTADPGVAGPLAFYDADLWSLNAGLRFSKAGGQGFIELLKQTSEPAAPSVSGSVRVFLRDNSGKAELAAKHSNGTAYVIWTQP